MAKTIESSCRLVKKGCTQIHKALQFLWGIAEGICRQLFFFENLILRLELVTCHFSVEGICHCIKARLLFSNNSEKKIFCFTNILFIVFDNRKYRINCHSSIVEVGNAYCS